ncbi:MAG: amino-acid N-acetyltransferase [Spirochaetaceae bacterium]|jgi:amino-acid N-acetyltransferase|nr:amino-acid N-acetyltransferase [Spirochaetaceae bacterium]
MKKKENEIQVKEIDMIREAFHYQSRFAGSVMVFKIDFPLTRDPSFSYVMKDLALLVKTGFKVVIVPGAKERIDAVLRQYRIESRFALSARITTESAMPFVLMAAFDAATCFMTGLSGDQVDAVIGNFVRARGMGVIDGVDMEHTGAVDRIATESVERILRLGITPILPCIGWSAAGKPYNVQSDEIALAAAAALGASKLFILSARAGRGSSRCAVPEGGRLTPSEVERILAGNETGGRFAEELSLALRAVKAGVERAHIIDGREEGAALRELFSNLGAGIMVYADEYEAIRPLKSADIPAVLRLMEPLFQRGNLVRRNGEQIREKKDDYVVFEIDGSIHACAALHLWGAGQGEIAALATDPAYTAMGLGRRLVRYLLDRAAREELKRVFVLTTRTNDWFEFLGFTESSLESLPDAKRRQYDHRRKSKVLALTLDRACPSPTVP